MPLRQTRPPGSETRERYDMSFLQNVLLLMAVMAVVVVTGVCIDIVSRRNGVSQRMDCDGW